MKKFILFLLVITLLTISCKEKEPTAPENESSEERLTEEINELIVNSQEKNYTLLENLFAKMDSTSAIDSVLKVFQADTNVSFAASGIQGISVEYRNGLRGGLFINPKDLGEDIPVNFGNNIIEQDEKKKHHT